MKCVVCRLPIVHNEPPRRDLWAHAKESCQLRAAQAEHWAEHTVAYVLGETLKPCRCYK
jgi:hypothetical protein